MAVARRLEPQLARIPGFYGWLRRALRLSDPDRAVFCTLVTPGQTVIEAGANVGQYTSLFARLVGGNGRVLAFEPNPEARRELESNMTPLARNGRVRLRAEALSDQSGGAVLSWPAKDSAQSSLRAQEAGSWSSAVVEEARVKTLRLDDLMDGWDLPPVGLVKLDVEGAELPALAGSRALLADHRPILHVEVCAQWQAAYGYSPRDLQYELEQSGFDRFFWVVAPGVLTPGAIRELEGGSANAVCFNTTVHGSLLESLRRE